MKPLSLFGNKNYIRVLTVFSINITMIWALELFFYWSLRRVDAFRFGLDDFSEDKKHLSSILLKTRI
jgi:hypothetical protein